MAIGADDAVRIDIEANDAFAVAEQIAAYAKDKGFDMIFVGKETISFNGSMVGGMLSEFLNLPYVSITSKLDIADNVATIEHDIDGGTEVVECPLPLLISTNKGMSEARIPNMRGIMAARSKPLEVVTPITTENLTSITEFKITPGRTDCVFVDEGDPGKLIELLHSEAKVL